MKNIINDPNNIYSLMNQEAEKVINEETKRLEAESVTLARQLAEENIPRLTRDKLAPYILPIKSGYKALAKKVAKLMASGEEEREDQMDDTFIQDQVKIAEQKKAEASHKTKSYQVQREKIVMDYNWKRYYAVLGILGLIAIIQIVVDGSSLQALKFSLITAYFFSAGLAVSTVTVSHKIKVILELVYTKKKKIALFITTLVFFGLVFLALASFRITMLNEGSSFAGNATQILSFVLLNEAILIGSLTLAFFALPSKIDDQKKMKFDELSGYINQYEGEVKAQDLAVKELKEGLHTRTVLRQKNKKLAEDTQEFIASLYEGAVGKFIQTNSVSRGDGIPECFSEDIPSLFNETKKNK